MNKQTRASLQDLAAILELLAQCEARIERIPKRFPTLYIEVPSLWRVGVRAARLGVEELARQIVQYQNLPMSCANLSSFKKSPNE